MHRFEGIQIWAVLASLMLASWLAFIVAPDEFLRWSREDGLVEWLGTLLFAAAAVLFIVAGVRRLRGSPTHGRGRTIGMLLFLGLVFSVAFMEEVSWGQRVIGWETPGALSASVQDESNLHNLPALDCHEGCSGFIIQRTAQGSLIFDAQRAFSIGILALVLVIPVAAAVSRRVRSSADWLGIPLAPLWVGALAIEVFLLSRFSLATVDFPANAYVRELMEAQWALLASLVGYFALAATCAGPRIGHMEPR